MTVSALMPIALAEGEGEVFWSFGVLATVKASSDETGGLICVMEQWGPKGVGSPLHVHHNEDEWFYILEGEVTFWVAGKVIVARAGSFMFGPRDIPHTFMISSDEARFLIVAEPGGFDKFMRELSQPALSRTYPPPATDPPDMEKILATAARYGIEILGPPGIPA
jgi:mannose-6-phosphate isomerase-like protein (cupin superfamily)